MSAAMESKDPPQPAAQAPAPAPANRRQAIVRVVIGLAVIAGLAAGVNRWVWNKSHVTSDNAEIEGSVVPALSRIGGFVLAVNVQENSVVHAGDPIVLLDDREQKAKLAQAVADYAGALAAAGDKGRTGQAEAQVAAARAQVAQAEANATRAKSDAERYRGLAARSIVSRQQLETAVAADEAAAAGLLATRKQVQAAEAGLQGADARLQAARAMRDQAALTLSYTRIVAPVTGVVSRKNVEAGQFLQAGQTLFAIVPSDDIYLVANLKETQVEHVRIGDPVVIDVDAYPHHPVKGAVESLSPATGAKFSLLPPDNATGNYTHVVQHIPVRIKITDRGAPERPLRPGMSVQITIATRTP